MEQCSREKEVPLAHWDQVSKLVEKGGLEIRPLRVMNSTLLDKWMWRLGDSSEGLWKSMLIDKYSLVSNGWRVSLVSRRSSSFWRSISSVFGVSKANIRYRLFSGEKCPVLA